MTSTQKLGEGFYSFYRNLEPCTPSKNGPRGRAKLNTDHGFHEIFPPTPVDTPHSAKRPFDTAFDDGLTGSPRPRKSKKLGTVSPEKASLDDSSENEASLKSAVTPPASPPKVKLPAPLAGPPPKFTLPNSRGGPKNLPKLAADEFKRVCESILAQVDWRDVEEHVASNRGARYYRHAIVQLLQSTVDQMWVVERSEERMREQRKAYDRVQRELREAREELAFQRAMWVIERSEQRMREQREEYDRVQRELREGLFDQQVEQRGRAQRNW